MAPGRIRTPLDEALLADAKMRPVMEGLPIPVGSAGRPEDVASLVRFLLGPEARFFCGSVVSIDGGTEALMRPDAQPPTFHIRDATSFAMLRDPDGLLRLIRLRASVLDRSPT